MISFSLLALFIPTFFVVSVTPGMCMTLAMTLGLTIGVRRTLWMMMGELVGVGLVAIASVVGVAAIMLNYPDVFSLLKWAGGAYLVYLGVQMWRSKGRMAIPEGGDYSYSCSRKDLALQGFVTAVANPKGWAFFVSLLPPFISTHYAIAPQVVALVCIILVLEFICLTIYASGGRTLRHFLEKGANVRLMNRCAGSLMMLVGIWLAVF